MVASFISNKNRLKSIKHDSLFYNFLKYLFFFYLYYTFVYGLLIPYYYDRYAPSVFFIKTRIFYYSFFILIMIYSFSFKGLKLFYKSVLYISLIILSIYWVSIVSGVELIPINTLERYEGTGIFRKYLTSYGFFGFIYIPAIFFYLLRYKRKRKIPLYYIMLFVGVLMLSTELLTLTRRVLIYLVFNLFLIMALAFYLSKTRILDSMRKLLIPSFIIFSFLLITSIEVVEYLKLLYTDIYLLVTTGVDSRGVEDYRLSQTGWLIDAKSYILEHLYLGTGYIPKTFEEVRDMVENDIGLGRALRAAGEVPIYSGLLKFGIIGVIIFIPIYLKVISLMLHILKDVKKRFKSYIKNYYYLFFIITFSIIIFSKFSYKFFNLFQDIVNPIYMTHFFVIVGILFSINAKLKIKIKWKGDK